MFWSTRLFQTRNKMQETNGLQFSISWAWKPTFLCTGRPSFENLPCAHFCTSTSDNVGRDPTHIYKASCYSRLHLLPAWHLHWKLQEKQNKTKNFKHVWKTARSVSTPLPAGLEDKTFKQLYHLYSWLLLVLRLIKVSQSKTLRYNYAFKGTKNNTFTKHDK